MANPDRRASAEDLDEFGGHELAGAPSIAALIAVLPEHEREPYRQARRAALERIAGPGWTWRCYLENTEPVLPLLPVPDTAPSSEDPFDDTGRNAAFLARVRSDLPPSNAILALAFDLAAALDTGDADRAAESAAALGDFVALVTEICDAPHSFVRLRERALRRAGLRDPDDG